MEPKKKWQDKTGTRFWKPVILTLKEGDVLISIMTQYGCANVSQLCKRIVRGELELKLKERAD